MREILFRAKRTDNGAWETGGLVVVRGGCSDEQVFISDKMTGYHTPALPETVGQFTGVTDRNGKKIFEWDIVKRGDRIWVIEYDVKCAQFVMKTFTERGVFWIRAFDLIPAEWCEVIGNIYDNPEPLNNQPKPKQKKEIWANAVLSNGEILFWSTGRERSDVKDFFKYFFYAGYGDKYVEAHKLELAKKKFEVDEDDICANNRVFEVDARDFYRQFRISPDCKGDKPY